LTLVQADHADSVLKRARQASWQELSDATRLQYAWPHPGKPRVEAAAFESPPPNVEPLPNFCLLVLEPVKLDHLELRGKPQNRWIYCRNSDQAWSTQAINP
jgi:hypothetical protein